MSRKNKRLAGLAVIFGVAASWSYSFQVLGATGLSDLALATAAAGLGLSAGLLSFGLAQKAAGRFLFSFPRRFPGGIVALLFLFSLLLAFALPIDYAPPPRFVPLGMGGIVAATWANAALLAGLLLLCLSRIRRPAWGTTARPLAPHPFLLDSLRFAAPCILSWGTYLYVYWPGAMTPDALAQWKQASTLEFEDMHPVAYTLAIWAIRRIWDTPGAVAGVQIALLAGAVGIALAQLAPYCRSARYLWLGSILLAVSPVIASGAIALWKDIPYTAFLVLFTACFFRIAITDGAWLSPWRNILLLAALGTMVALLRHNGVPAVAGGLLAALLVYPARWQRLIPALLLVVLALGVILGPVYDSMGVKRRSTAYITIANHVAGLVIEGAPLDREQQDYLQSVGIGKDSEYYCFNAGAIVKDPHFHPLLAETTQDTLTQLWLRLALRVPLAELAHLSCAGDIIWKIAHAEKKRQYTRRSEWMARWLSITTPWTLSLVPYGDTEVATIWPNDQGLRGIHDSPAAHALYAYSTTMADLAIVGRPAFCLYLLLAACFVARLRSNAPAIWLIACPLLTHSAVLFVVMPANDIRYQLIAFFCALIYAPWLLSRDSACLRTP